MPLRDIHINSMFHEPLHNCPAIKEKHMKPKYAALLIMVGLLVFPPFWSAMNTFMFLQLNPLQGESIDDRHKNWMEINSFEIGIKNPSATALTTTRTTAKAQVGGLVLTKYLDKASVLLALAVSEGKRFPKAVFEVMRKGGEVGGSAPRLRLTLEDVSVTSMQQNSSSDIELGPTETIELTYGRITREYFPVSRDGRPIKPVVSTWDVRTNQR